MTRRTRPIGLIALTGLFGGLLAVIPAVAQAAPLAPTVAAEKDKPVQLPKSAGKRVVLETGGKGPKSKIDAPSLQGPVSGRSSLTTQANITVIYDAGFTPEARAAFQSAVDTIATLIVASQPIVIDAKFESLGATTLGSAGAGSTWLINNKIMPAALANEIRGYDVDDLQNGATADVPEVEASFSKDRTDWYFGTTGAGTTAQYDFKTVVMHEIWHGLGFAGTMGYSAGSGSWGLGAGYPSGYDQYATTLSGTSLINTATYPNPSTALGSQLTGGGLQYTGPFAQRSNNGVSPRLYAPATWVNGSSYSHLDETTYPSGTANSLLTFRLNAGEVIHSPGPIALGMFRDMGWNSIIVPAKVTGVTATPGSASATVTWTAPDNGGEAISSYLVTPSTGTAVTVTGTTTSRTFTGLSSGTAYTFTVKAINAIGSGPVSASSASVTPAAATAPSAPTGVTAVAGNASAQVSWTAPANGGSAITGYTVTSSPGGLTATVPGTTTTASVTGLTNGTAYTFTVKATNAIGTSATSTASTSVTPVATAVARIDARYASLGGSASPLGLATGPIVSGQLGTTTRRSYERGIISQSDALAGGEALEVYGAIYDRYSRLGQEGGPLGRPLSGVLTSTDGVGRVSLFERGGIFWHPATGAHEVRGDIAVAYAGGGSLLGAERSSLGYPLSDEIPSADGVGRHTQFQNGVIFSSPTTGAHTVSGLIRVAWERLGGERGPLGYPTSDELGTPDGRGRVNQFQNGAVYWSPATGAFEVRGAIEQSWERLGAATALGYPRTDELATPGGRGRYNHFERGSIYWTPTTNAHEIHGAIRDAWSRQGWESGPLGFPRTDELPTGDGRGFYSAFEAGAIYWTPATGAHEVRGGIYDLWSQSGTGRDVLGYPLTEELGTPDGRGRYNHFERGSVYWTPQNGAQPIFGAIRDFWARSGWERSALGYPRSGEIAVPEGVVQYFDGGMAAWDSRTGAVRFVPNGG